MAGSILNVGDKIRFGGTRSIELDFVGRANLWIRNTYDDETSFLFRRCDERCLSERLK